MVVTGNRTQVLLGQHSNNWVTDSIEKMVMVKYVCIIFQRLLLHISQLGGQHQSARGGGLDEPGSEPEHRQRLSCAQLDVPRGKHILNCIYSKSSLVIYFSHRARGQQIGSLCHSTIRPGRSTL